MSRIVAVYGSPRHKGNTSLLLKKAVQGARETGANVEEVVLRDLEISPCLEIYGCRKAGRCVIRDDFQSVQDQIEASKGLMIASPVKKYWIDKSPYGQWKATRKGLFISAGATKGKKLFDGALLTMKYFFDVFDMELWRALLYRGLDLEGDVLKHPEFLEEAFQAGKELCLDIEKMES
jgi:multimeric flavodoxin WrbA